MRINGIQVVDEMLRSLRRMAVPVMLLPVVLLAAMSLVGCGDSKDCKDACDGTQQEIDRCRALCDEDNL